MRNDTARMQSELARLRHEVSGARSRPSPRVIRSAPVVPAAPEWRITTRSGGTYTAGTDWNPQFDALNVTYYNGRKAASGGHFEVVNNSNSLAGRARLVFDSESTFGFTMPIELNGGRVQVQDNGRIQEATTSGTLDLQFYRGRNVLELFWNDTVNFARFIADALDHIRAVYVPPGGKDLFGSANDLLMEAVAL